MEMTRSEQRLIHQAETGSYERGAKWATWVVAIVTLLVAVRLATVPAHQEYMYLLASTMLMLGTLSVLAMRDRSRSLQLIRKLRSVESRSPIDLSANSAVNSLSGD